MTDFNVYGTRLGQPGLYERDHRDAGQLWARGEWSHLFARACWMMRAARAVDVFAGHAL